MRLFRRLRWMARNWRYQWTSFAEEGVYVMDVSEVAGVRGMRLEGPVADDLRVRVDGVYGGRQWDSAHGVWTT